MLRSQFSIIKIRPGRFVLIKDNCNDCGSMSVTNDAENVVRHLLDLDNCLKPEMRLFYFDSDGRLDEIVFTADKEIEISFRPVDPVTERYIKIF